MPYKRKYNRRPRRRRRSRKSSVTPSNVRRIARSVFNKNTETKMHQTHMNETSINTFQQGTFFDPMDIDQGTLSSQRIGNKINLTGFQFKGVLNNNGANTNYLRMIVFFAKDQSNFTGFSNIFASGSTEADFSSITGLDTMYYPMNKRLISVLHDRVYKLGSSSDLGLSNSRMFSKFIKLRNTIHYNNTSTGADNVHPRLHVGIWAAESSDDTGTGQNVEVSGLARLWYKDA